MRCPQIAAMHQRCTRPARRPARKTLQPLAQESPEQPQRRQHRRDASASSGKNSQGCAQASHSAAGTVASPSSDRPMLENGSGEVFTAARVVALARWLVAASVPPSKAAAVAAVALIGAEYARRQRRAGRDAQQRVQQVPQRVDAGNLVGEELDEEHHAAGHEHHRMLQQAEPGRQFDPAHPARHAGQEEHRVEAQAAGPAERGGDGDELRRVDGFMVGPANRARACRGRPARPRGPRRWRGCRRCGARCRRAARR